MTTTLATLPAALKNETIRKKVIDRLVYAANRIEKYGLAHNTFFEGNKVCVLGGLMGPRPDGGMVFYCHRTTERKPRIHDHAAIVYANYLVRVRKFPEGETFFNTVSNYNDTKGRQARHVVSTLRSCAAELNKIRGNL